MALLINDFLYRRNTPLLLLKEAGEVDSSSTPTSENETGAELPVAGASTEDVSMYEGGAEQEEPSMPVVEEKEEAVAVSSSTSPKGIVTTDAAPPAAAVVVEQPLEDEGPKAFRFKEASWREVFQYLFCGCARNRRRRPQH